MKETLGIIQIFTSLSLVFLILIQTKGTGLGRVWGSGSVSFTRRGLERYLFRLTFLLTFIFVFISILQVVV